MSQENFFMSGRSYMCAGIQYMHRATCVLHTTVGQHWPTTTSHITESKELKTQPQIAAGPVLSAAKYICNHTFQKGRLNHSQTHAL